MEQFTRFTRRVDGEVICDDIDSIAKGFAKLADFEDAEEEGRLIISPHKVGDLMFMVYLDDVTLCYELSGHIITDICKSGAIITDAPVGDPDCEVWDERDQRELILCFSREEAEAKLKEMENEDG